MIRHTALILALALLVIAGGTLLAQDPAAPAAPAQPEPAQPAQPDGDDQPDPEAEAMAKWMASMTPGDAHKQLQMFVGEWDTEIRIWMAGPDAEPTVSKGHSVCQSILDGRFVAEHATGVLQMPGEDGEMDDAPFEGYGLYGFDNNRRLFTMTWVDNFSTATVTARGQVDPAGKHFRFYAEGDDPIKGVFGHTVKVTITIIDNDHYTVAWQDLSTGEPQTVYGVTYTRCAVGETPPPATAADASALIGKWAMDIEEAAKKIDADPDMSDEEKQMAKGFLQMMASMTLEITAEELIMGDSATSYKVIKAEGNRFTIETTDEDGTTKSGTMEINGDRLTLTETGDDEGMPFKRVK